MLNVNTVVVCCRLSSLACRHPLLPVVVVCRHCPLLLQSLLPLCRLRSLLLLPPPILIVVSFRWHQPSFHYLVRRHCCCFLSVADIFIIPHPPLLHHLSLLPSLVWGRASSPPPSPLIHHQLLPAAVITSACFPQSASARCSRPLLVLPPTLT